MSRPKRRPPPSFRPPPPPGRGGKEVDLGPLPPLPPSVLGAPPAGAPPGATRPPPRLGGIRGVGVPPEIRRRAGAVRAAPGAADVVGGIQHALRKAQKTLLGAQKKLQLSAAALRVKLATRH